MTGYLLIGLLPGRDFLYGGRPNQAFQQQMLIGTGTAQPVVQHRRNSDIGFASDQPPHSLGEAQPRPGNHIVGEGVFAF